MNEGRKPEYQEKTPDDELHKGTDLLRQLYVLPR